MEIAFVDFLKRFTEESVGIPAELALPQIAEPAPKPAPVTMHSGYLQKLFSHPDKLREMVEQAVKDLRPHADSFEAIAFRGMSGAVAAAPIALALGKHLTCVRKDGEDSHADFKIEGARDCRYIIVDDLISSGRTVVTIQREIYQRSPTALCVGIYLYNDVTYWSRAEHGDRFYFPKF